MSFHLQCAIGCAVVISLMVSWSTCHGGKVLVVPLEGSHWINMDILIKALDSHGHDVTVLRTSKSWYIEEESLYYKSITIQVEAGVDEDFIKPILDKLMVIERGQSTALNFLSLQLEAFKFMSMVPAMVCDMVTSMFEDEDLMATLRETRYDLVLTDPAWGGGILLARYLQLPLVYNVRWVTSGEGHLAISPSPLSYIPITGSGNSDKMTFTERVKNVLFYLLVQIQHTFLIQPYYQAVCDKYLDGVNYNELLQGADLWLMRVDFVFEFPRPTMPNVIYMGGFQCKPAKPLPQDLEEFVQSSGEHGVILMSLGTFVGELPQDLADEVAAAFSELPQKVIWRYKGRRPATLGNNTLIVDWMPQNDLLGHPKIKAFVAHGGTNGVQEALYHGVPILGLPLIFDQHDNVKRIEARGAGKTVDIFTMDREIFRQGLQEVLHEPSYRLNMQRLSRLHRDQPMKPLDSAVFWIEFVMRHKGASHLRTESYKMPWYVYHSIDVMVFLLTTGIISMLLFAAVLRCCFKMCLKRKIKHE